jgi:hypothetical protein
MGSALKENTGNGVTERKAAALERPEERKRRLNQTVKRACQVK